jgi:hypothetical protein
MGEEQASTPAANGGGNKTSTNNNNDERKPRRNRNRNRNNRNRRESGNAPIHIPKEKFIGRSEDLKGFTYDVVNTKGGVAYTRTTDEIARHVGEKYTVTGSYIRTAILTLSVPAPPRPLAPTAVAGVINPVDQEIFKEKIQMYVKTKAGIKTAMKSLYDLIWGQCSESIRSRLRGYDDYTAYSANADSMALLKGIRAEMTHDRPARTDSEM